MATLPGTATDNPPVQSHGETLHVLAVIPGIDHGSSFIFARRQIAPLESLGVSVRPFYLSSRTSILTLGREFLRFKREVRQFHPQIVHAHFGTMTSLFCALSSRIPLIISFRGSDLNGDPDLHPLRSRLGCLMSQIAALRAERILCETRQMRDRLWWRKKRAIVVPTGVDLDRFRPQPKREARAVLSWPQEQLIVVFNGEKRPHTKGSRFAEAAVRVAEKAVGPIRLVNFDGGISPDLIPTYLNAADCLILASVLEGSPNIIKEALACDLPIVSTDVGDVAERLRSVFPSTVVRNRDLEEFGRALSEILRRERRSNGRTHGKLQSELEVATVIRSVYDAALGPPPKDAETARFLREGNRF